MTAWPTKHLTADDLDAFHSGALGSESRLHLETCEECHALAAADVELVGALGRLESLAPSAHFADRVMARVAIVKPGRVPVLSFPKLSRRRVAALATLAAGMVASVMWSAAYRAELETFLGGVQAGLVRSAWIAVRAAAVTVTDQPWFETLRSAWLAPARLAAGILVGLLIYGSGLLALRRLVTPSAGPVSGASA
jgi:hypothetical protein